MKCKYCQKEFINKGGLAVHEVTCGKLKQLGDEIIDLYINNSTFKEISKKYNLGKDIIRNFLLSKNIEVRNPSMANVIAHKKYPNSFITSEETKDKIRQKRLEYMKNHPESTAWRKSVMSYPEKIFLDRLIKDGFDKKYLITREESVFPYFVDFAFDNEKIAVEIDGSQHLEPKRKEDDIKKDNLLVSLGWKVLRFTENEVKKNMDNCINTLKDILVHKEKYQDVNKYGIFTNNEVKIRKLEEYRKNQKERIESGHISQRKTERPSYQQLLDDIEQLGYRSTGRKYGVSDNAIRKWKRFYER